MRRKGPWSTDQIERFLREIRVPVRIACNGASGHPVLASLWFVPLDGKLWCATQRTARVVSILSRDPRCAFEVSVESPPYFGVRGSGLATRHDDRGGEILRTLIDRYLGDSTSQLARFLLERVEHETAMEISPQTLVSWDYRERMATPHEHIAGCPPGGIPVC
jgi:nitroimidazol reductase NimA-like FMN-containing flavoprotein (pyridoxamine 5'-phosphate oxidase superfamily)